MPNLEIHYAGEWAALYVDGKLERVGDSYLAEERAFELAGVATEHDNAFMRGQDKREGVAQTLDEVAAYRAERERRAAEARRLREQATQLLADADALDSENSEQTIAGPRRGRNGPRPGPDPCGVPRRPPGRSQR